jgi:hypothetical protein
MAAVTVFPQPLAIPVFGYRSMKVARSNAAIATGDMCSLAVRRIMVPRNRLFLTGLTPISGK